MNKSLTYKRISFVKLFYLLSVIFFAGIIFYFYKTNFFPADTKQLNGTPVIPTIEQTELIFRDKNYSLSYSKLDLNMGINISTFGANELWKGSGFYDSKIFFEYPYSLTLAGSDRNLIVAEKELKLDLGKAAIFDLILNLQTDPDELETANLIFIDENKEISKYTLPKINKEWNYIKIIKEKFVTAGQFDWNKITGVRFEFQPRPLGKIVVSLAGLRGEVELQYLRDWHTTDKQMLILDNRNNIISLMVRNMKTYPMVTTMKEIINSNNYSYQVAFSPLTETWSGLFLRGDIQNRYGYYFMVNGLGGNKWQIYKLFKDGVKILGTGIVPNLQFKKGEWYYLKAEVTGDTIKAYLSKDGKEFISLGTVSDNEFISGGIGLSIGAGAVSLFNDFVYTQN